MIEVELPDGSIAEFPDEMPPDQIKAVIQKKFAPQQATPQVGVGEDMLKAGATGVGQGVISLAGSMGDVSAMNSNLLRKGAEYVGAPQWAQNAAATAGRYLTGPMAFAPTSEAITKGVEGVTGPMYQAQTTPGKYAQTVGQFAPSALLGPGRMASKLASGVGAGLLSEGAGQAAEGSGWENTARIGGALLGAGAPMLARKVITPNPISAERVAQAEVLRKEGVPITAGQKTGNNKLRYRESEAGGAKMDEFLENQGEAYTKAALSKANVVGTRASPEVMDKAFRDVGAQFDNLASAGQLIPDQKFAADITQDVVNYGSVTAPSMRVPIIEKVANDILNLASRGPIDGKVYKTFRSQLSETQRKIANTEAGNAIGDIIESLDDAMQRSNPHLANEWKAVRRDYRNLLVLERAATGAGENAAMGIVSPAQLRNAAVTKHGRRNYARGKSDFAELARAGEAIMKQPPNSGTASRLAARMLPQAVGAATGGAAGYNQQGWQGGLLGALAGAALPAAMGRMILSAPGRAYLGNQVMAGVKRTPKSAKAARALLGTIPAINNPSQRQR